MFRTPDRNQFIDRPSGVRCLVCLRVERRAAFDEQTNIRREVVVLLFRDRTAGRAAYNRATGNQTDLCYRLPSTFGDDRCGALCFICGDHSDYRFENSCKCHRDVKNHFVRQRICRRGSSYDDRRRSGVHCFWILRTRHRMRRRRKEQQREQFAKVGSLQNPLLWSE